MVAKNYLFIFSILLWLCTHSLVANATINIVAAENFYGEVAKEIGGDYVAVVNILNNPSEDPHLFTTKPSSALAVSNADIIVFNGLDYDPWMQALLTINNQKNKSVLNVAQLMKLHSGNNPHLWYQPNAMPVFAEQLVKALSQKDPAHQLFYTQQLKKFMNGYQIIFKKLRDLKQKFHGVALIATEPVFNYMAEAAGMIMHGEGFQISIMNDVPPTISQVKQFEDDLHQHAVRVLIFNNQVINPTTEHMLAIARNEKIPTVGVSETLPINMTYVQWMMKQLIELENALNK